MVEAVNVPLRGLIAFAYGLDVYQAVEGTSTLLDDKFDLTATAAGTVSPARRGRATQRHDATPPRRALQACRAMLERAFDRMLEEDLSDRVLNLDEAAAAAAAQIAAGRQRAGRMVDLRDTLIAGIAQARRGTIATRNTGHFEGLDVPVVDPWRS